MGRGLRLAAVLPLVAAGAACVILGPAKIDDAAVRDFVAQQQAAWNAHNFKQFYDLFDQGATFVTEHRSPDGKIDREKHTVAEDWSAASAFFAAHPQTFQEHDSIARIAIGDDGQTALVVTHEAAELGSGRKGEKFHATTVQTLTLRSGHIVSLGETKTTED